MSYITAAVLAPYFSYDLFLNKNALNTTTLRILGVYNMLFLIAAITVTIMDSEFIFNNWWLFTLFALPTLIFQILKFRNSSRSQVQKNRL
ncbi:hypothetical protein ES711_05655 [Gelidibacter salicanalis]|uniref:Uncharacterized protein n=1 Tax=Gelidibacter salicanalis TaxID=291193 RepID=A0A5C7ASG6_9FLAO|nr:hypothetical protein [Gelidibacter salicanalis]TXE09415.1 hypothetical protein ES711_05655 [Gelidibacter salicanalis]